MKKALYIIVPIIILLGVGGTVLLKQKTAFAPSGQEGMFDPTNRNEPPSPFSTGNDPFEGVQAPGAAFDLALSDLVTYFNQRLAYALPAGNPELIFDANLKVVSTKVDFNDLQYTIFDFTGDGKKDAVVTLSYIDYPDVKEIYMLSTDPMVVPFTSIGKINEVFGSVGITATMTELQKFGPKQTVPLFCENNVCTTLGWSKIDSDGYKTIGVINK
jgi:hypothetical protein